MEKGKKYFFISCVCLIYILGCTQESKKVDTAQEKVVVIAAESDSLKQLVTEEDLQKKFDSLSEEAGKKIEHMKLLQPVRNAQQYFFSNKQTPDEFSFYIPAGPVGETKILMLITTSGKDLIFSDTIQTRSLARWMVYPDEVPTNLNRKQYLRFMINYLNRINEKDLQAYMEDKAQLVFDEIFKEKQELKENETYIYKNTDIPQKWYDEVMSSNETKLIYWPCYDCEEGGNYLGYSKSQKKVIPLAATE